MILFNPYKKSYFYRLGKYVLEKVNRWPYGYEQPIGTLTHVAEEVEGVRLRREYSVAFLHIVVGSFGFIPGLEVVTSWLNRAAHGLYRFSLGWFLDGADRLLSTIFGGYLLVSVLEKNEIQPGGVTGLFAGRRT